MGGHGVSVSSIGAETSYTVPMITTTETGRRNKATAAGMSRTVSVRRVGTTAIARAMLDSITTTPDNKATDAGMSRAVKITRTIDTPVFDTGETIS